MKGEWRNNNCVGIEKQTIFSRDVQGEIDTLPRPKVVPGMTIQVAAKRIASESQLLDTIPPRGPVVIEGDIALDQPISECCVAMPMVQH